MDDIRHNTLLLGTALGSSCGSGSELRRLVEGRCVRLSAAVESSRVIIANLFSAPCVGWTAVDPIQQKDGNYGEQRRAERGGCAPKN